MRTYFFTTLVLLLTLTACKSNKKQDNLSKEGENMEVATPAHNSENSLDWSGIYQGVLPYADCEGIQTKLILKEDLKYEKEYEYLGKEDDVFIENGKFKWNDAGTKITLWNSKNEEGPSYQVGENKLIKLDIPRNRIQGELASKYELTKEMSK